MDENASDSGSAAAVTTAAAAGRNTTSSTSPLVQSQTSSLLVFAFINSATTLVCACLTAVCVLSGLGLAGYRRRREHLLSERLGAAAQSFCAFEPDVEQLLRHVASNHTLQFSEQLKQRVVVHGVTDFDLLAYKFRVENGVYGDEHGGPAHRCFVTLKRLEHLFESVAIQLPAGRRAWWGGRRHGAVTRGGVSFGAAVCRAAVMTSAAWCDDYAPTVRAVVRYLGGRVTAGQFDAGRQTDSAVERRVLASVPYVRSLSLTQDNQFVLTAPSSVLDRQLRARLTAVDELLTGTGAGLSTPAVTDAYRTLREVCIDSGLVRRADRDLPERPPSSPSDQVQILRHLLRLACGTTSAARRTETDQRFIQLVTRLHDQLIASVDADAVQAAERCRDGTRAIAEILTSSLSSVDPHFTKTTLEHVERELCRHVSRLVAQSQVSPPAAPAQPRPMSISTEPVTGPSGLTVIGVEESSSSPSGQYATAVSLSSVEVDDQPASGNDVQETAI